jgi:hypothetical protein
MVQKGGIFNASFLLSPSYLFLRIREILPQESYDNIQDLIFIFNIELGLQDDTIYNLSYHNFKNKYKRLKDKWERDKKNNEEMERKIKSKKKY